MQPSHLSALEQLSHYAPNIEAQGTQVCPDLKVATSQTRMPKPKTKLQTVTKVMNNPSNVVKIVMLKTEDFLEDRSLSKRTYFFLSLSKCF